MPHHTDTSFDDAARRDTRRRRLTATVYALAGLAAVAAVALVIVRTFPSPAGVTPASTPPADSASGAATRAAGESVAVSKAATPAAASHAATPDPTASHAVGSAPAPASPVLPLGMAYTLPDSRQMVVATGPRLGATHGTLRVYELAGGAWVQLLSVPCRFGTNGLIDGTKRVEGDRATPTGIWWPGGFVWGWHGSAPGGTSMPYRQTTQSVWWSDVRDSTYNTWVVSAQPVSGEHLVDAKVQYEFAWSTGYNAPPNTVVKGRGSGIFLHVFDPPDFHNGLSAGCVAIARDDIIRVFRVLDPALKPSFAIGTDASGTPTSISAY